jgi:CheY-like chemotaxis protein
MNTHHYDNMQLKKGNERILLVDDDVSNINVFRQMLEHLGYSVVSMTDSVEALACFRSDPEEFDLVITDFEMPRINGEQLASELIKTNQDTPIILCTGNRGKMNEEKARRMGIKGFAMKPLDISSLARIVRKILDLE